uniref:Uncharacterized protein n=1 Tax=Hyaloperonospora arabidopsidis (strain Emoy2) TaxID=559515 RepID=M4BYL8_HYAAE
MSPRPTVQQQQRRGLPPCLALFENSDWGESTAIVCAEDCKSGNAECYELAGIHGGN